MTPEEWEQVQEIIDRRPTIMKGNVCPFCNLFHGLVYCATCGKSMQVRYEKVGRTGKNRFTDEMREPIDKAYYKVRNQEIDGMFLSLYTDTAKGVLTEQRFMKLTAALAFLHSDKMVRLIHQ